MTWNTATCSTVVMWWEVLISRPRLFNEHIFYRFKSSCYSSNTLLKFHIEQWKLIVFACFWGKATTKKFRWHAEDEWHPFERQINGAVNRLYLLKRLGSIALCLCCSILLICVLWSQLCSIRHRSKFQQLDLLQTIVPNYNSRQSPTAWSVS